MRNITIEPKNKPRLKDFRNWLAWKLVNLAKFIYPQSEAVKTFYMQLIHDETIYGRSVFRVSPEDIYKD